MKRALALLSIAAVIAACSTKKNPEKQFFTEVGSLSKEEILARGDALAAKKKWEEARKYYSFLADSFPNDPLGRQASLKVADTFFQRKDVEGLTEAQLRYKDFSNRFPNDPNRAYALLMLGKTSYMQSHGPLRDLTPLREAADSFKLVLELFPDSPQAAEAKKLCDQTTEELAEHELDVGRYYFRIHAYDGARNRIERLLATYPSSAAAKEGAELLKEIEAKTAGEQPPKPPAKAAGDSTTPQAR